MSKLDMNSRFNKGDIVIPVGNPFDEQLGEHITYTEKVVVDTKDVPNGQWIKINDHYDWIHAAWFKLK